VLVLSRKRGEEVVIGDNIRLTVVAIRGKEVRLGITAPSEVTIWRTEICLEVEDFGTSTASPATSEEDP
jgi:carbon storage regulator